MYYPPEPLYDYYMLGNKTNISFRPYDDNYVTKIIDNECCHIDSKCRNRRFCLYDFKNHEFKDIYVCNDKLKLIYDDFDKKRSTYSLIEVIESYLQTYVEKIHSKSDYFTTRTGGCFAFIPYCERPKMWHRVTVTDYVKTIYENKDNHEKYYYLSKDFTFRFCSFLERANLKKHYKFARIARELKKSINVWSETDFLTEINELFYLIINHKYN